MNRWIGQLILQETNDPCLYVVHEWFGYIDRDGKVWMVEPGLITDGASVPWIVRPIIGDPFTGEYRKPAVIHDAYYLYKTEPRDKVDRMFREAMYYAKEDRAKAQIMYQMVRLFGWIAWDQRKRRHAK